MTPRRAALLLAVLVVGAAAACSPSSSDAVVAPVTSVTTTTVEPVDDRVLKIGVLLPLTGAGGDLGTAMLDGVDIGIDLVNQSGGVLGSPVQRYVEDEGDGGDAAAKSMAALLGRGVDAIIGPASSLDAARVLPTAVDAGVITCSPTASAMSLDAFPDQGRFIRTIPSDSLQAAAIGELVERSGERQVAIVYLDDPFGRGIADRVRQALDGPADVVAFVPFDPDDADLTSEVATVVAAKPKVTVVIAEGTAGPRMVEALFDAQRFNGSMVINDAMRVPALPTSYSRLTRAQLERIRGVSPISRTTLPLLTEAFRAKRGTDPTLFASNAYDCVNLLALAALENDSTKPTDVASVIADVTSVGTPCFGFSACARALVEDRNIAYNGASGELTLGTDGDPRRGVFEVFGFDENGRDQSTDETPLVVTR